MKKIELEVINITQGFTQHHSYAVVLGEVKGKRRLPIVIGAFEAQAIAIALENMAPARPLTHDLFKIVMDSFHVFLSEIVITNIMDGIFYSKLICIFNGEEYEIDSRTSDAIALAIRFACPIYIYNNIFETSGIILMEEEQDEPANKDIIETQDISDTNTIIIDNTNTENIDFNLYTNNELNKLMQEALANEFYEKAASIRDVLNKRHHK